MMNVDSCFVDTSTRNDRFPILLWRFVLTVTTREHSVADADTFFKLDLAMKLVGREK